jgi:hypothetical protein
LIGENAGHLDQGLLGTIDDVRIYDRALTAAEVMAIYVAGN